MVRAGVLKISSAFLAGLVVALGSALLYMHVQERESTPVARVEQAPTPEPPPQPATSSTADPEPEQTKPEQSKAEPSTPQQTAPRESTKTLALPSHHKRTPPLRERIVHAPTPPTPVQVVENTPSASVPAYPTLSQAAPDAPEPAPPSTSVDRQSVAPPDPHQVTLGAGTTIAIRLAETLSTEHNYTGDTFRGTLNQPIVRNGFIIADKGSKVLGRVVDATPAGRVRGVSNLSLALTEINTTDGQRVHIATNSVEKHGVTSNGKDAAKIAGGAALGALIGALGGGGRGAAIGAGAGGAAGTGLVLATRGKAAVLPNESLLSFQLSGPVTITEQLSR